MTVGRHSRWECEDRSACSTPALRVFVEALAGQLYPIEVFTGPVDELVQDVMQAVPPLGQGILDLGTEQLPTICRQFGTGRLAAQPGIRQTNRR
jgi:hypothetical protein